MKGNLKKVMLFVANPRLLFCIGLAWLITNGWAYLLFGLGNMLNIQWMTAISGTYIAFLWLPVSPEKLVTVALALALLRILFPKDEKTLMYLTGMLEKAKKAMKKCRKNKREMVQQEME